MSIASRIQSFVRRVARRREVERQLDEELSAYVDLLVEDLMQTGLSADEARRAANIQIGGFEHAKDEVRDQRPGMMLDNASRDLRFGLRLLRRSPGFATVAILTIAVGIGATSAIFSVIDAVALKPLPYPASDRLVSITSQVLNAGLDKFQLSPAEYLELDERAKSYSGIAAYRTGAVNVSEGRPERATAIIASRNIFDVLGVQPKLGRAFTPEEATQNAAPTIIVSDGLWRRSLGADPSIIGKQIEVQARKRTVVGVTPPGLDLHDIHPDVWIPLSFSPAELQNRGSHPLNLVARLEPSVELAPARAELTLLLREWSRLNPGVHTPNDSTHRLQLSPLRIDVIGNVSRALWVLQGAVALVLLIACSNVANLLLVRAEARQQEFAIRLTLGASQGRILRQYLAEGVVLTMAGTVLGLVLARWGLQALLSISPNAIPRSAEVGIDSRVLMVATAIATATALVFALAPMFHLGSAAIGTAIRDGTNRSTLSAARRRVRRGLLVGEVAVAVMLVVGASLLVMSFRNLTSVDAGFDPRPLLTFGVNLPAATYQAADRRLQFVQTLDQAIRAIPDVDEVAAVSGLPPKRPSNPNLTDLENIPPARGMPGHAVDYNTFAAMKYLDAIRVPIVRGRGFTAADAVGAPVVVINQAMAKRFFPDIDPIGKRLRPTRPPDPTGAPDTTSWFTIIGVAKDVKQGGLDQQAGTEIYYPLEQLARINGLVPSQFSVVVRSRRNGVTLASAVDRAVRSIDPGLPVIALRPMTSIFDETLSRQRFLLTVLGIFAAVALGLAAVGTYGVLSYLVTERRSEIGIRVALGAGAGEIVRLVVGEAFTMTVIGLLIGMAGALAFAGVTRSLLFGVSPFDPVTYVTVASIILVSAISASLGPTIRALRIDPLVAIRGEL